MIKIVETILEKIENFNFFLMWTTLNFKGLSKTEKQAEYTCKIYQIRTRLVSVYLMDSKLINSFLVSWIFQKNRQYHIVGCQKYYKPIKFDQNIVDAIFEKIWIFLFSFLMWTTVNFRARGKIKNKMTWIFAEDPRYGISTISVDWFRRNVQRLSQSQTDK